MIGHLERWVGLSSSILDWFRSYKRKFLLLWVVFKSMYDITSDPDLNFGLHIKKVIKTALYHIRNIFMRCPFLISN